MKDEIMDKKLNIETTGLVEWPLGVNLNYFRTESSSYKDLDRLISFYDFPKDGRLVDYGSGKGRIVFYLNYKVGVKTTGIEINRISYSHLIENYNSYQEAYPDKARDVLLLRTKAEEYQVREEDNVFYFFNPFTGIIFGRVIRKIEESLKKHPRQVDIILYYPNVDYTVFLENRTDFRLIQVIKTPKYFLDNRECFKVYRYSPE